MPSDFPACLRRQWLSLRAVAVGLCSAALWPLPLPGQDEVLKRPEVQQAMEALRTGHPMVAVETLDRLLPPGEVAPAMLPLARLRWEALARQGDWERLRLLTDPPLASTDPVEKFWRALALAQSGEAEAAALLLAPLATAQDFPLRAEAVLNLASLQIARGDYQTAMQSVDAYTSQLPGDSPVRLKLELRAAEWTFNEGRVEDAALRLGKLGIAAENQPPELRALKEGLHARLAAAQGRRQEAVDALQRLATLTGVSDELREKAAWWLALLDAEASPESARDRLLVLIETRPRSPRRERYFRLLETLLTQKPHPKAREALTRWSQDETEHDRQWLAGYLLASLPEGSHRDREQRLLEFGRKHLPSPAALAALYEAGLAALDDARIDDALQHGQELRAVSSPQGRSLADSLEGRALFAKGDLAAAAQAMEAAARTADIPQSISLSHRANAALATALAGQRPQAVKWAQALKADAPLESTGDLAYEIAMNAAARGEPEAFDSLTTFTRQHPGHRFAADAEMALVELHLNQVPPRTIAARERLEAARQQSLTSGQKERADYIAVWVEIAADRRKEAKGLAEAFLKDWPNSSRAGEITLLLAEQYYETGDYAQARTWFLRHATSYPGSPQAEAAQFFAALSAKLARTTTDEQQARELWRALVQRRGPYAAAAQHELGLLDLGREDFEAAIASFDAVLTLIPAPELRYATLCDRGQALFAKANLQGGTAPEDLARALASFTEVEEDPGSPRAWRLQAAVRRGRCLEMLGRPVEALSAYQTALALPPGGLASPAVTLPMEESDWYYRAGFAAIRLLDAEKRHREAVEIAEVLATSRGSRSLEARDLATDIRLRHFLWEGAVEASAAEGGAPPLP